MEKDFVKLNEEELKGVVGGVSLNYRDKEIFINNMGTAQKASDFLIKCGVRPSDPSYRIYMDEWIAKNGK